MISYDLLLKEYEVNDQTKQEILGCIVKRLIIRLKFFAYKSDLIYISKHFVETAGPVGGQVR